MESTYFETQRWIIEKLFGWRGDKVEAAKFDEVYSESETSIVNIDGLDVGWMSVRKVTDGSLDLDALYLLPIAQNKGIGTALVQQVIERSRDAGVSLTVSTAKINPARRLYERLGFVVVRENEFKVFMQYGGHVKAQSAIILPVPEAEPFVSAIRKQHDPSANLGVPAHITLLYPFLEPTDAIAIAVPALAALFADFEPFEFELEPIGRFERSVHFKPTHAERFIEMTKRITGRWPSYPPYGGKHSDVVPHLTVAESSDQSALDLVQATDFELPIHAKATEAWLITSDGGGRWHFAQRFPLRGRDLKCRANPHTEGR